MCVSLCLCVSICLSRSLLSPIMSVWKAGGIIRTVLARACYIPSFTQFHASVHAIARNFHAIWAISAFFWVNINMLGIKMHVLELRNSLVILSHNFRHLFTQFHTISLKFHAIFTQFWLFQPFLDQFLHVGYQNACTRAKKFIGNTFTQFHALLHAISRNFTQFSRNLGYLSYFWANFNMLGIKKHLLELRNSLVVLGEAIGLKKGLKAPKKRPKASKRGRRPPKALRRS